MLSALPFGLADNHLPKDLDYSGYHKTFSNSCLILDPEGEVSAVYKILKSCEVWDFSRSCMMSYINTGSSPSFLIKYLNHMPIFQFFRLLSKSHVMFFAILSCLKLPGV